MKNLFLLIQSLIEKFFGKGTTIWSASWTTLKYASVGVVGFGIYLGCLYHFTEHAGFKEFYAIPLALVAKRLFTFFSHKVWTFNAILHKTTCGHVGLYVTLAFIFMGLTSGSSHVLVKWYGVDLYVAQFILVVPLGLLNFISTRYIVAPHVR